MQTWQSIMLCWPNTLRAYDYRHLLNLAEKLLGHQLQVLKEPLPWDCPAPPLGQIGTGLDPSSTSISRVHHDADTDRHHLFLHNEFICNTVKVKIPFNSFSGWYVVHDDYYWQKFYSSWFQCCPDPCSQSHWRFSLSFSQLHWYFSPVLGKMRPFVWAAAYCGNCGPGCKHCW